MLARERVLRTRRALGVLIAARALLWAAACGAALGAGAAVVTGGGDARAPLAWAVAVTGVAVALVLLVPAHRRLTVEAVALWLEERFPQLRFALVTAVDPRYAGGGASARLERAVAGMEWDARWRAALRAAAYRAVAIPAVAAAAAAAALVVALRTGRAETAAPGAAVTATSTDPRAVPAPFARLSATVRTPAYAGGRTVTIPSPASIAALVGSAIEVGAPGAGDAVVAQVGGEELAVARGDGRWRVRFTLGADPAVLRLRHPSGERLVALEPRPDSAPVVVLRLPARDTVFREPRGAVPLAATATDDIGLASIGFEYIVSSGAGETFEFRSGVLGTRRVRGVTAADVQATLRLDALGLRAGDVVHVRAVARDGKTIGGAGVGASETRTLRVARAGEYDSLAVEGAPPPEADQSVLSQRMLIILTERLVARQPRLEPSMLLAESRGIARDQARLRRRVGDIIFARLGDDPTGEHAHGADEDAHQHAEPVRAAPDSVRRARARTGAARRDSIRQDSIDAAREALLRAASAATTGAPEILDFAGDETPVVAINRPLLEAYNAMWEASRELDQGQPRRALPPMRRALEAIQRARQAERIYLRGAAPTIVVDLARVRLAGKDTGQSSTRTARPPADSAAGRRAERLAAALVLVRHAPADAIDSLTVLRVDALGDAPALAAAIGDALAAMRAGRDATDALARARRIAAGGVRRHDGLGPWSAAR